MHLLAPLAETPIHSEFRDRLRLDDVFSDVSYEGWRQGPGELAMIEAHPAIFPNFHAVPTRWLDRRYVKELRDFVVHGVVPFKWMLIALYRTSGDLLDVFDTWRAWRCERRPRGDGDVPYYARIEISEDFLEFVRESGRRYPA
jgi:hypothetical protein